MKIKISSTILNPNGETPKNFSVESRRRCQTEYAVDSALARVFDRENAVCTISFEVERAHSSTEAAEAFTLSHAAEIHALPSAELSVETGGGSFRKNLLAFLRNPDARARGMRGNYHKRALRIYGRDNISIIMEENSRNDNALAEAAEELRARLAELESAVAELESLLAESREQLKYLKIYDILRKRCPHRKSEFARRKYRVETPPPTPFP